MGEERSFVVPQHMTRESVCTVPKKAEEQFAELSRGRTGDVSGRQYIEFLGLRLLLHPEGPKGWRVEVESVVPQAVEFWDHHKGIRRGDVLTKVDGREVASLDGAVLEKALFQKLKEPRRLVFKRSAVNHLRWLREGEVPGPWEEHGEVKVLTGLQRLAEELRSEEERRRLMEQQTLLTQELASKLSMSQESEREYVRAEAELFAAKNFREEKDEKMGALVEQMALETEETALKKLAKEHEIQSKEMQAEEDAWRRKKDTSLED